ncbi:uncharacterized protein LOC105397144 [Plutella xylostella]|uniref:uncharacterized protein LOC105397144 n=1 Tax=Plutella xylostella TaxID=51655 RepID=UPI002032D662|nr:uncharacterized protein LOC105397144 [Plutella xylostella]
MIFSLQVVLLISLALSAVSAGSGPYLPSGWKPAGPAFYLPGEVAAPTKPADNPLKESLQVEAEGSDFLKEYGPPKTTEVQDKNVEVVEITKQELPELAIARNFAEIRTNIIADDEIVDSVTETVVGVTEEISEVVEEVTVAESSDATTENVKEINEDVTAVSNTEANLVAEVESDVTTQALVEAVTEIVQNVEQSGVIAQENQSAVVKTEEIVEENENANSQFVSAVEEREGKSVVVTLEEQREETIGAVRSIEDALVNLENEIKAQQVQNIEAVAEVKSVEENSGSVQQNLPEGFLEYGPPGFQEYGPPKQQLRTEAQDAAVDANETRRRRFSPKFRQARRAHH